MRALHLNIFEQSQNMVVFQQPLSSCYPQIVKLYQNAGLQSVINEGVYFSLLKKINSVIITFKFIVKNEIRILIVRWKIKYFEVPHESKKESCEKESSKEGCQESGKEETKWWRPRTIKNL
ncbi:MAG: hypothetical protein A2W27_04435 [Deltaproteobacteria bacterium RBG_16_44_11]|nr:MAG: hypothetical protein A2W27_04435 [Deltaproteobacteria bacterium RBG_16_44_11]